MLITCSRCFNDCEIETKSDSISNSFVCMDCRCTDCYIVLCVECPACNNVHGKPSSDNPRVCEYCTETRSEVATLDQELQAIRAAAIAGEEALYI